MSETAPERTPPSGGGSKFGLFTEKIGPLPMWAWVAIIAAGIVGWRLYSGKKNASSSAASSGSADGTGADQVPQFVNQTYVTTTPPVQGPPGPPGPSGGFIDYGFHPVPKPQPGPEQLTRTWTAPTGGVSDLAQIAQRLTGTPDPGRLHPVNKIAQNFISGPFRKNRNAKVPKGAQFSYTEGTVTPKGAAVPTVK